MFKNVKQKLFLEFAEKNPINSVKIQQFLIENNSRNKA